jgi:hypothetical protein
VRHGKGRQLERTTRADDNRLLSLGFKYGLSSLGLLKVLPAQEQHTEARMRRDNNTVQSLQLASGLVISSHSILHVVLKQQLCTSSKALDIRSAPTHLLFLATLCIQPSSCCSCLSVARLTFG